MNDPDLSDFVAEGMDIPEALQFWGYLKKYPKERRLNGWREIMDYWKLSKASPQGSA